MESFAFTASPPNRSVHHTDSQFVSVYGFVNGVIIPIWYFMLFAVGIVANSVVFYVSTLSKSSKSVAVDIFVGNLAIADLSLIATLPVWAVTHIQGHWVFGNIVCKAASILTNVNMYASVFLITVMAIDRYNVVVKGIKVQTKSLRTAARCRCLCAIVWVFSILLAVPSGVFRGEHVSRNKTYCSWKYPENQTDLWWVVHMVERNVIGFIIPLIIICRCYFVLVSYVRVREKGKEGGRLARASSTSSEARDGQVRRITKTVTTIIIAFTVCWLPNQTSNFISNLIHFDVIPKAEGKLLEMQYMLHLLFAALSFCNSVVNPIIYSASPTHRARIEALCSKVHCCVTIFGMLPRSNSRISRSDDPQSEEPRQIRRNRGTVVSKLEFASHVSPPSGQRSSLSSTDGTRRQRMNSTCLDDGPDANIRDQPSANFDNVPREDINANDTDPGQSLLHGNEGEYKSSGL